MKPDKAIKAIQSIADGNSIMSKVAEDSLENEQTVLAFCDMMLEQDRDGNREVMYEDYGEENVKVMISYSRYVRAIIDVKTQHVTTINDGYNFNLN